MPTFPEPIGKQKVWVQVISTRHYFLLRDVPLPGCLRFDTLILRVNGAIWFSVDFVEYSVTWNTEFHLLVNCFLPVH